MSGSSPRWVVGLDLSLTSTGIGIVDLDSGTAYTRAVRSSGKKTDTLAMQVARIQDLTDNIVDSVTVCDPELVVVESAAFSTRKDSSAHRRAGLWWSVVGDLHTQGFTVVTLSPSELKKFATGKGNASKDAMVARAVSTWGEEVLGTQFNDTADALFLATAGAFALGETVELSAPAYRKQIASQLAARLDTTKEV